MRTHYWCEKYSDYRNRNKLITGDRSPPDWFLKELKELDPCLKVEWWNHPPGEGMEPTFRLVRVVPDGRWAHVRWFKVPSFALLHDLRMCDTQAKSKRQVYNEELRRGVLEDLKEEEDRRRVFAQKKEDAIHSIYTLKHRLYSYRK